MIEVPTSRSFAAHPYRESHAAQPLSAPHRGLDLHAEAIALPQDRLFQDEYAHARSYGQHANREYQRAAQLVNGKTPKPLLETHGKAILADVQTKTDDPHTFALRSKTFTNMVGALADSRFPASLEPEAAKVAHLGLKPNPSIPVEPKLLEQAILWSAEGLAPRETVLDAATHIQMADDVLEQLAKHAWSDPKKQQLAFMHLYQVKEIAGQPNAAMMTHIARKTQHLLRDEFYQIGDMATRSKLIGIIPHALQRQRFDAPEAERLQALFDGYEFARTNANLQAFYRYDSTANAQATAAYLGGPDDLEAKAAFEQHADEHIQMLSKTFDDPQAMNVLLTTPATKALQATLESVSQSRDHASALAQHLENMQRPQEAAIARQTSAQWAKYTNLIQVELKQREKEAL